MMLQASKIDDLLPNEKILQENSDYSINTKTFLYECFKNIKKKIKQTSSSQFSPCLALCLNFSKQVLLLIVGNWLNGHMIVSQ